MPPTLIVHMSILTTVHMTSTSRSEKHLDADDKEHGYHGYQAGHGRVSFVPEIGKTWVCEGCEGGGKEVDEGRGDEDPGTEMARKEEESMGNGEIGKSSSYDGERACC